ncbi:MAG TPA: hypothetical protein VMT60_02070 [Candidatus Bathyarchaeia archaeon]|nr:hypothetical protein [Candidatus Bathyarchaeia archaeon]
MRGSSRFHARILALVCVAFCGCALAPAPVQWIGTPYSESTAPHGAWVQMNLGSPADSRLRGELIAVSKDSLYVADATFHAVARGNVVSGRIVMYSPSLGWMVGSTFLGTLSTGMNGWMLVFTAPMWIVGGSVATCVRSFEPIMEYPACGWSALAPYARFPQGLPVTIDRSRIRMKSYRLVSPAAAKRD